MKANAILVHATTIAIAGRGIMLRGAPGSGKSSLALRLMEETGNGLGPRSLRAHLVADDQTELYLRNGTVWARCPKTIRGKLEIRGLGIVTVKPHATCPLSIIVDLTETYKIERMPEPADLRTSLMGLELARIAVDPQMPVAPSLVRAAFRQLC